MFDYQSTGQKPICPNTKDNGGNWKRTHLDWLKDLRINLEGLNMKVDPRNKKLVASGPFIAAGNITVG